MFGKPIPVLLMARELTWGGSERQMTATAIALAAHGFDARVACFIREGVRSRDLEAAGVPVVHFPVRSFRSIAAFREARTLAEYIKANQIRIVHTWDPPSTVWAIPATRTLTGAVPLASQRSHRELIQPSYRALVRATDRIARGIVVNCEFLRRHLIEDENVPEHKVHVCHNGLDLSRFRQRTEPANTGTQPGDIVIGTVCVLRPEKDVATLLRAFAMVRKTHPRARLLIVGSGAEHPALERLTRELDLINVCTFQPGVRDVLPWLRAIDIFVLPSVSEALSNSLMEAMAARCFPIASEIGGNPELIRNGDCGVLFPPRDAGALAKAISTAIDNPERLRAAGERAQAFIEKSFSLDAAGRRMAEIYASLLGESALSIGAPTSSGEEALANSGRASSR